MRHKSDFPFEKCSKYTSDKKQEEDKQAKMGGGIINFLRDKISSKVDEFDKTDIIEDEHPNINDKLDNKLQKYSSFGQLKASRSMSVKQPLSPDQKLLIRLESDSFPNQHLYMSNSLHRPVMLT